MSNPLVSILVPVYNVEAYIERCARSIFEQTYENLEIIFVDDCSPDRSVEVLESVLKEYPNRIRQVQIIHHKVNRGLSAARNTGVAAATGDFIIHVDSDDEADKQMVERLVDKQLKTNADIVSGEIITIDNDGSHPWNEPNHESARQMLTYLLNRGKCHSICSRLIRRSLYIRHNIKAREGIDIGEDTQVIPLLVYFSTKVSKIDDVVYHYIRTGLSLTRNKKRTFNKKWTVQYLESLFILKAFFETREKEYFDTISKSCILQIYSDLIETAKINDIAMFKYFKGKLYAFKKKDAVSLIGHIQILYYLKTNFYFLRYIYIPLSNLK